MRFFLERTNPWADDVDAARAEARRRVPSPFVDRRTIPALRGAIGTANRAHLVVGPRQAGKSTAIWRVLADEAAPLLFLDCEEPLVRHWCASPGLFAADLRDWLPPGGIVFLEEAQWLDEAGLFLKGVVDA
jgi:hypothetical protein